MTLGFRWCFSQGLWVCLWLQETDYIQFKKQTSVHDGICCNLFSVIGSLTNAVIILVSLCYTGKKYLINWVKKTHLLF